VQFAAVLANAQDAQIVGREPVITLWGQNVSTKPYEEKFYPGLEHVLASTTPNLRRVRAQGQHRSGNQNGGLATANSAATVAIVGPLLCW
jgi:hypothetical protein